MIMVKVVSFSVEVVCFWNPVKNNKKKKGIKDLCGIVGKITRVGENENVSYA